MVSIKRNLGLGLFYLAAVLYAGCLPEESLKWSDDGSVGLLSVDEGLYVVDGETGELDQIVPGKVEPWPDISADGKTIVYCQKKTAASLADGLNLLNPREVQMIVQAAQSAANAIVEKGGIDALPESDKKLLESEDFGAWVARYISEKGSEDALVILGADWLEKTQEAPLPYFEMVLTDAAGEESRPVTRSILEMGDLRLSPKAQNVAYLAPRPEKIAKKEEAAFSLLIASVEGDVKRMLVGDRVPVTGYDWRPDGQAIAYINADEPIDTEKPVFASLRERVIADSAGNLLAKETPVDEPGDIAAVDCSNPAKELASTLFFLFSKVRYAPGGRIFFCSAEMKLPAPLWDNDEPRWSVYCYDTTIGSVVNVLPWQVAAETSGYNGLSTAMFSVSPDGRKLLLAMEKNRFAIYEPAAGPDSLNIPLGVDEGFGDEPELVPAWKGNRQVSFIVSDKSHFDIGGKPKAIGVLDENGAFTDLSKDWPPMELLK